MKDLKVVTIKEFSTAGEAAIYQSLLEANGIQSQLLNETAVTMLPLQNEMMQIVLVVNEEDEARAKKILAADFDHEEFAVESAKRHKKP